MYLLQTPIEMTSDSLFLAVSRLPHVAYLDDFVPLSATIFDFFATISAFTMGPLTMAAKEWKRQSPIPKATLSSRSQPHSNQFKPLFHCAPGPGAGPVCTGARCGPGAGPVRARRGPGKASLCSVGGLPSFRFSRRSGLLQRKENSSSAPFST